MRRRTFVALAATGTVLAVPFRTGALSAATTATPTVEGDKIEMTDTTTRTGYAPVNGLQMYYEIHGSGGVPLVLLHGGFSTIDIDFGRVLPALAQTRQVIATELQGHGHTADIDRPLAYDLMAGDVAALLEHLGMAQADIFGYSVGAAVAIELALQQPTLVRKLVLATPSTSYSGLHPGLMDGLESMTAEVMYGSPFHDAYLEVAPNPEDFETLFAKKQAMDRAWEGWSDETIQSITAPALLIAGDADIVRPEHVVEMFRLFGGGVAGDIVGLPPSRLAILPGTTHITLVHRGEWLSSMVSEFLDAPMPEAG
jgi:pimeloyl-ACP methyl ester carboxylesterase